MNPRLPLAFLAASLALAACRAADDREPESPARLPQPTEHWQDEAAEREHKRQRRAWMESMHRTAPDVDWREIERQNGLREMRRRRRIARSAEEEPPAYATLGPWTEVGSRNQAGRTHCAMIGPDGPGGRRLYVGSSLGGVWRGNLDGTGWVPMGDNLYGGAHEILVVPGDGPRDEDVVLVATDGGAVHVTRDGGAVWEAPVGLETLTSVRGVGVLDDATDTMVVLGIHPTGVGQRAGLFASVDRGRTFENRWTSPQDGSGCIWVPRKGVEAQSTIYLTHRGRLRVSTDSGYSFPVVATIDSASSRSRLCGSEAGAPTLYAALRIGGTWELHRSDDAGLSWTMVNTIGDFWESICASTLSPGTVVYGGVEAWRSTDHGASFAKVNAWWEYYDDVVNKLHADLPGIYCWPDPDLPALAERWYLCTDGGLFQSSDQVGTVVNHSLSGLGISQYYSTHTSVNDPDLVLAGSQDQGYQRGLRQPPVGPGPSSDFDQLISGDYGHLTSSDGSHQLVYSTYPGFILVQEGETNPTLLYPWLDFPAGSAHAWLPPVVADPLDAEVVFFLADRLWRYTRASGADWNHVQHSTQDFGAGSASYLSALAFSPADAQRVYAVTNDGALYHSGDHGVTWTPAVSSGPDAHYFYGNAIAAHPTNPDEAVVGGSGYSGPGVVRTVDGGLTWTPEALGLPNTLVYDVTYAGDGSGDLYAATEAGAYRWNRTSGTWTNIMSNQAPVTLYWSVESVDAGEAIRFGTYGRGIWDYDPSPPAGGTWAAYGVGLGGANVLDLDSVTPPVIGATITFDVSGASGEGTGLILSSQDPARFAMWGGTLLLDDIQGVARMRIDANGEGSRDLWIPNDVTLIGSQTCFQAMVFDPAMPEGVALSNGLVMYVGP